MMRAFYPYISAFTAACLCLSLLTKIALSAAPIKKPKGDRPADGVRLEQACLGCFPNNHKTCAKEQWTRCCEQEIACHDDHCRGEVLGRLQKGMKVRVGADFVSDDEDEVELTRGMTGRVLQVDSDNDAYIKFWRDEYDEDYLYQWVTKKSFWANLEVPGSMERMRAAKTSKCLDNCSRVSNCVQFPEMSTKKKKNYQMCIASCKMDACNDDEECKPLLEGYATCKQQSVNKCSPLQKDEM